MTDQNRIQRTAGELEAMCRTLLDTAYDAIFLADAETGVILDANRKALEITGLAREELVGSHYTRLHSPAQEAHYRALFEQHLTGVSHVTEAEVRHRDGRLIPVEISAALMEVGGRKVVQGIFRDLSHRRHTEAVLREHIQQVQTLLNAATDSVLFLMDLEGHLLVGNETLAERLGKPLGELIGADAHVLLPPEVAALRFQYMDEVRRTGQPAHFQDRRAGLWIDNTIYPVFDAQHQVCAFAVYGQNITERKRLESQLQQAQKMEAIGRLAGGVAHDFNNLLTAIIGNADLALSVLQPMDSAYADIRQIQEAAMRAASLTRQLLAFSRRQIIEPRVVDLNELITGLHPLLRRVISEDIELALLLATDLGPVELDPGQFEQVILNLVVNARDAMPEGGVLTLETANVHPEAAILEQHPEIPSGEYVRFTVRDTGVGMTEEVKTHLFEPFFTTKDKSKGTGLGLATAYGILKQNRGFIYADSEAGQGAAFHLLLPRVEAPVQALQREEEANLPLPYGTETILLVEDEQAVRELAARVLRQLGYQVWEAGSGQAALQLAQQHAGERFELLLTDVVLPGISGRVLADHLTHWHPELKVLFTSGYAEEAIVDHQVLEPGLNFIAKPFSPATLARRVRQVLDTPENET